MLACLTFPFSPTTCWHRFNLLLLEGVAWSSLLLDRCLNSWASFRAEQNGKIMHYLKPLWNVHFMLFYDFDNVQEANLFLSVLTKVYLSTLFNMYTCLQFFTRLFLEMTNPIHFSCYSITVNYNLNIWMKLDKNTSAAPPLLWSVQSAVKISTECR